MSPGDYEESTREMLTDFKGEVRGELRCLNDKMDGITNSMADMKVQVTNHLAHRLPAWVAFALSSLMAVIGYLLRG